MRQHLTRRNIQRVDMKTFGDNVKRLRRERDPVITQEELAKALDLERNAQISIWETSEILPKTETIVNVAAAFSVLLGRDVQPRELLRGVVTEYDKLRGFGGSDPVRHDPNVNTEGEVSRHADRDVEQLRKHHHAVLERIRAYGLELIELVDEAEDFEIQITHRNTGTGDRRPDE